MNIFKKIFAKVLTVLLIIIYGISIVGILDKLGSIFNISNNLQIIIALLFAATQFAIGLVAKYKKSVLLSLLLILSLIIPLIIGPYIVFGSLISFSLYSIIVSILLILICGIFYFKVILPHSKLNSILYKQKNPELYINKVEKLMLHSKDKKEKYGWYIKKASALIMLKKYIECIDILQEVELDKLENLNQLNYYIYIINCYLNIGNFDEVNDLLDNFKTYKPESKILQVAYVNAIIYFFTLTKRFYEAKEEYNKSSNILHNNSNKSIMKAIKDTLATYEYFCGNINESKKMFLELDDLEHDDNEKVSVNYFLGLIFLKDGKEIEAKYRFEKVLRYGENGYFCNQIKTMNFKYSTDD